MKKILVLTDFSDNANRAAEAAVTIAGKLHANIILFNTYVSEPVLSEYGGAPWPIDQLMWADEGKDKLEFLKEELQEKVNQLPAGDHRPSMIILHEIGALGHHVKTLLQHETIEMIVMGARNGSAWEHLLTGSDTTDIIEHSDRPVLIIPEGGPLTKLRKVMLAADFDESDAKAAHYLTQIGRLFGFSLDIVNISLWGKKTATDEQRKRFEKQVAKYDYPAVSYHEVGGKELIPRLNSLCAANNVDLLVLVHDRHSWLAELFKKNNAQALLGQQKLPVLIIPASFAE